MVRPRSSCRGKVDSDPGIGSSRGGLHGDSWYLGTQGLSAVLVKGDEGLALIDGGLPQSAPLIAANIKSLGFELEDIRWILNSHAHYDHAGGIAALQRMSGAKVAATVRGAEAIA